MPQDYIASGYAYTRRYDEIIKDITCKMKIVDNTLLYDSYIEGTFNHTFDFWLHCTKKWNGTLQGQILVMPRRSDIRGPPDNTLWSDTYRVHAFRSRRYSLMPDHGFVSLTKWPGHTRWVQSCSSCVSLSIETRTSSGTRVSKLHSNIPNRS